MKPVANAPQVMSTFERFLFGFFNLECEVGGHPDMAWPGSVNQLCNAVTQV